jgi:hypothetical protein
MPTGKKKAGRRRVALDRDARKVREAAIIEDLKKGDLSYRMIAEKHGVSLPTVNAKARKAGVRRPRGRRPMAATAGKAKRGRPRGAASRPASNGRRSVMTSGSGAGFDEAFRQMVLQYFPSITLAEFDRLAKLVERAVH